MAVGVLLTPKADVVLGAREKPEEGVIKLKPLEAAVETAGAGLLNERPVGAGTLLIAAVEAGAAG